MKCDGLIQLLEASESGFTPGFRSRFLHAILEIFYVGDTSKMKEFYDSYYHWQLRCTKDPVLARECSYENFDILFLIGDKFLECGEEYSAVHLANQSLLDIFTPIGVVRKFYRDSVGYQFVSPN